MYKVCSISEFEIEIKNSNSVVTKILLHNLIEQFIVIKNKTEQDKMKDFFFQKDLKDSIIIQKGLCPNCYKKGIQNEWSFFRSYKVCQKCDWHD